MAAASLNLTNARWRPVGMAGANTVRGSRTVAVSAVEARVHGYLQSYQAELSMKILAQQQAAGRFPLERNKDFVTVVDRRHRASEYNVRFGGKISYLNTSSTLDEVLDWIAEQLVNLSPVGLKSKWDKSQSKDPWRKEHYQDAHLFMQDGRAVQTVDSQTRIVGLKRGSQYKKHVTNANSKYQFVNTMVYARRIENGGVTTNNKYVKPWSAYAPSGIYKKVARAAVARFGGIARIKYVEAQLHGGAKIYAGTKHSFSQFYPTIVVTGRAGAKVG